MKNFSRKTFSRKPLAIGIAALLAVGIHAPLYAEDGVDHETVETTETETTLGVGEEIIVEALSEAMVAAADVDDGEDGTGEDTGDTGEDTGDTEEAELEAATATLLEMRESGMGWGQIANELGFKLGHVMGDYRSSRPESVTERLVEKRAARAERTERVARVERVERAERPERPERAEKSQRPERPTRPSRN